MQKPNRKLLIFFSSFFFCLTQANAEELEINGLVINQTHTLIGQEFYYHFCSLWEAPRLKVSYNISIKEIPDARWGSLITVKVNDRIIYRKTLRPRGGKAEQEAQTSIRLVRSYLQYLANHNGLGGSKDLKGNGY